MPNLPSLEQWLRLKVDSSGLKSAREEVKRYGKETREKVGASNKDLEATGGLFARVGSMAKLWIGVAAVSAVLKLKQGLSAASREAGAFESSMNRVSTMVDGAETSVSRLRKGLVDISKRMRASLADLSDGLYQALSSNIDPDKVVGFMEVASRASVAGGSTVVESVDGITASLNGFGKAADEAADVADTLFVGVRRGVNTFGSLAGQIGNVAGLASSANITLEETVAAQSALSLSTNDSARAMTQYRGIVQKIIKPTEQGQKALDAMGVSLDATTIKQKGLFRALMDVREAADRTGTGLGDIFEDVEGLNGILTLTGPQAQAFASIMEDMAQKAGETDAAYRKMAQGFEYQSAMLKQRVTAWMVEFGDGLNRLYVKLLDLALPDLLEEIQLKAARAQEEIDGFNRIDAAITTIEKFAGKTNLIVEQQDALAEALALVQEQFPEYISQVDAAGRAVGAYTDALRGAVDMSRRAAIAQQGEDLRRMIDALQRAQAAATLWRTNQRAYAGRVSGIRGMGEFQHMDQALSDPKSVGSYMRGLAADYTRYLRLLEESGEKAATAEAEYRNAAAALGELFQMAGKDKQILVDALISAGMSASEAADAIDDVRFAYDQLMGDVSTKGRTSGGVGPFPELMGLMPSWGEGMLPNINADIQALIERRDKIIATGAATRELADINRQLYEAERKRNELMEYGTAALKEQTEAAERTRKAWERYQRTIESIRPLTGGFSGLAPRGPATPSRSDITGMMGSRAPMPWDRQESSPLEVPAYLDDAKNKAAGLRLEMEAVAAAEAKAREEARRLAWSIRTFVDSNRRMLDVVHSLGLVDDKLVSIIDNALSAVDAFSDMKEASSWEDGFAKDIAQISSVVGIVGGIAGTIGSIASAFQGPDEAVVEAIRENTRRLEYAIDELINAVRVGSEVTQAQADDLWRGFLDAYNLSPFSGVNGAGTFDDFQSMLDELFESMKDAGGNVGQAGQAFEERFRDMIGLINYGLARPGSQAYRDAESQLDEFLGQLAEMLGTMQSDLGQFNSGSPAGIIGQVGFLSQFAGVGADETWSTLIGLLQNMPALGGDLTQLVAQLAELTPSTDTERINELLAAAARSILEGTFDLGDMLTPEDLDAILQQLQGLASGGTSTGATDEYSRSVQIARSITEVQSNELIAIQETALIRLGQILAAIQGLPPSYEAGPFAGVSSGAPNVSIGDINVSTRLTDDVIDEVAAVLAQRLRQAQRSGGQ